MMTELYQSQRAMRNMRKAAMQRGVVAVLDVGTSKIACLILRFDGAGRGALPMDGVGSLAGQAGFRVIGAANHPFARGALRRDRRHAGNRTRHPHRPASGAEDGQGARGPRHRLFLGGRSAQLWPGR